MTSRGEKDHRWRGALDLPTFALPLAFTFFTCGIAGYFGKINLIAMLLMALTCICLQLVNNVGRLLGDKLGRERAKNEYYERKFAQYKNTGNSLDPFAGTAGDLQTMNLKSMFLVSIAMSLVMGFGLITSCTDVDDISMKIIAMCVIVVVTFLIALRYMGTWSYGYRVYGNIFVFLIFCGCEIGGFYLLTGSFLVPVIYPAIGIGALAVAVANMNDIYYEKEDADLEQTDHPRRTVPIAAGINGAFMLQIVSEVLAMIWLASFPVVMGSTYIWNYAFILFYIPLISDIVALRKSGPSDIPRLRTTLAISTILLSVAFLLGIAGSNLGALFAFVI